MRVGLRIGELSGVDPGARSKDTALEGVALEIDSRNVNSVVAPVAGNSRRT